MPEIQQYNVYRYLGSTQIATLRCEHDASAIFVALKEAKLIDSEVLAAIEGSTEIDIEDDVVIDRDGGWYVYNHLGDLILYLDESETYAQ